MNECILCKDPAVIPCPRCLKPLCASHGMRVVDSNGVVVYDPGANCKAPVKSG